MDIHDIIFEDLIYEMLDSKSDSIQKKIKNKNLS